MDKFIVTVEQLAQIVDYCIRMTIMGSGCYDKDWTENVKEAIDIYKARTVMSREKIILDKSKSLTV
jgi:hypothetical protein